MQSARPRRDKQPVILIVDDTSENLNILGNILSKSEYTVIAATTGAQALEAAAARNPDLILLDIQMPEMDGFEVCQKLKENPQTDQVPVIFLTAKIDKEDIIRGFMAGARDYVTKPFNSAELLARVRTHLELKFALEKLQAREKELTVLNDKLARANRVLMDLSLLDPLTGIANRRHFDQVLQAEWKRLKRNSGPLALVMVDIDHFKLYNDTYGHQAGDECLKNVAGALLSSIRRASDVAARYGGEEFVLVLPETDLRNTVNVANKALKNVASLEMPHAASPTRNSVTISAGAASMIPTVDAVPEELVSHADQALYRAKSEGRNRVETWP